MPRDNEVNGGAIPGSKLVQKFQGAAYRNSRLTLPDAAQSGIVFDRTIDLSRWITTAWPVRDQQGRGTCVAFAAAACVELLEAKGRSAVEKLSPHYLYYCMREKAKYEPNPLPLNYNSGATKLWQAKGVLRDLGICTEEWAPYEAAGAPSPGAEADAITRKRATAEYWDYRAHGPVNFYKSKRLYDELRAGRPVAVGLPTFSFGSRFGRSNWSSARARSMGIVFGPTDRENIDRNAWVVSGHVVCLMGFTPDANAGGGGWFIFRNSWGRRFGQDVQPPRRGSVNSVPAIPNKGYGALTVRHIDDFCWEYLSLN